MPVWRKSSVGMLSRRTILTVPIAAVEGALRLRGLRTTDTDEQLVAVSGKSAGAGSRVFARQNFGTVGIFDVDWLVQPQFTQLLDNLAASPGAFHGVRFFGAFTAGQREAFIPESGGTVWTRVDQPIDFATTFRALEALTTRGLIPFVVLGFFPPAVSSLPIRPPPAWDRWKTLVRTFFASLPPIRASDLRRSLTGGSRSGMNPTRGGSGRERPTTTSPCTVRRRRQSLRLASRSGSVDRPLPTSPKYLRTMALPGWSAFFGSSRPIHSFLATSFPCIARGPSATTRPTRVASSSVCGHGAASPGHRRAAVRRADPVEQRGGREGRVRGAIRARESTNAGPPGSLR